MNKKINYVMWYTGCWWNLAVCIFSSLMFVSWDTHFSFWGVFDQKDSGAQEGKSHTYTTKLNIFHTIWQYYRNI